MLGKAKCKILKEIRRKIASENDIPYVVEECTHQGDCAGTCPRCEADLRYLERELEKRRRLGKAVTVAALAGTLAAGVAGCTPEDLAGAPMPPGEMPLPETTAQTTAETTVETTAGVIPVEIMGDMAPAAQDARSAENNA